MYPSIYLSIFLSIYLSIYLSPSISLSLSLHDPSGVGGTWALALSIMGISGTIMYEAVVKRLLMMVNASKIDGLSANDDVYIYIYIYMEQCQNCNGDVIRT